MERGEPARDPGWRDGSADELKRTMVTSRGTVAGRNVTPALRDHAGGNKKPPSRMGTSGVVLVVPPHFAVPETGLRPLPARRGRIRAMQRLDNGSRLVPWNPVTAYWRPEARWG